MISLMPLLLLSVTSSGSSETFFCEKKFHSQHSKHVGCTLFPLAPTQGGGVWMENNVIFAKLPLMEIIFSTALGRRCSLHAADVKLWPFLNLIQHVCTFPFEVARVEGKRDCLWAATLCSVRFNCRFPEERNEGLFKNLKAYRILA